MNAVDVCQNAVLYEFSQTHRRIAAYIGCKVQMLAAFCIIFDPGMVVPVDI